MITTVVMAALLVVGVAAVAIGVAVGDSKSVPVTLGSAADYVAVTNATCDPSGSSVNVSAQATAVGSAPVEYPTLFATVYDANGQAIGSASSVPQTIQNDVSVFVQFAVPVSGTPAGCTITWGPAPLAQLPQG